MELSQTETQENLPSESITSSMLEDPNQPYGTIYVPRFRPCNQRKDSFQQVTKCSSFVQTCESNVGSCPDNPMILQDSTVENHLYQHSTKHCDIKSVEVTTNSRFSENIGYLKQADYSVIFTSDKVGKDSAIENFSNESESSIGEARAELSILSAIHPPVSMSNLEDECSILSHSYGRGILYTEEFSNAAECQFVIKPNEFNYYHSDEHHSSDEHFPYDDEVNSFSIEANPRLVISNADEFYMSVSDVADIEDSGSNSKLESQTSLARGSVSTTEKSDQLLVIAPIPRYAQSGKPKFFMYSANESYIYKSDSSIIYGHPDDLSIGEMPTANHSLPEIPHIAFSTSSLLPLHTSTPPNKSGCRPLFISDFLSSLDPSNEPVEVSSISKSTSHSGDALFISDENNRLKISSKFKNIHGPKQDYTHLLKIPNSPVSSDDMIQSKANELIDSLESGVTESERKSIQEVVSSPGYCTRPYRLSMNYSLNREEMARTAGCQSASSLYVEPQQLSLTASLIEAAVLTPISADEKRTANNCSFESINKNNITSPIIEMTHESVQNQQNRMICQDNQLNEQGGAEDASNNTLASAPLQFKVEVTDKDIPVTPAENPKTPETSGAKYSSPLKGLSEFLGREMRRFGESVATPVKIKLQDMIREETKTWESYAALQNSKDYYQYSTSSSSSRSVSINTAGSERAPQQTNDKIDERRVIVIPVNNGGFGSKDDSIV
ncbi:uncharacterized protein V1516DRAFT_675094 [Lipomyces oligophaga]|uniref:uncharacterized protein n=1 Tax=Lipomyces oligophaga TaxID=45792 RepID=UPI0034CF70EB